MASAFDTEGSLIRVLLHYGANKTAVLSRSPPEISPIGFDSSSISSSVSDVSIADHFQPSRVAKNSKIIKTGSHRRRFSSSSLSVPVVSALSNTASEEQVFTQNPVSLLPCLPVHSDTNVKAR